MTSRPLSVGGCARRVLLCVGLAGLALPAAGTVPPTVSAELARCAALTAAEERLACYDALNCAAVTNADERLACYDALAKTQSARPPAAPAVAPAAAASDGAIADAGFGAAPHKSPPTPKGPEQIKALVAEVNVDRLGTVTVSLENGQTWTFHDPEPRIKSGDEVTIRRASLGSYLMTIPGRHTYRVQRTR